MLNLIADRWIPVRRKDGSRTTIAPWQMAGANLDFPDWPRPDLNIACLELLVGLVFLADPPRDAGDWRARQRPDPDRLRDRLAPFAPAFELIGEGPRFMQDLERLEDTGLSVTAPGNLFIDSGGEVTFQKNSDLFVKRDRYATLSPALAAIALFTTQVFAYADSSKHRASLRGNGPLVTMVDPGSGLWSIIWANVPFGTPCDPVGTDLPWLRAVGTQGKSSEARRPHPQAVGSVARHDPETFFSMSWRMRLVAEKGRIVGTVRKEFGTDYEGWMHPLTPYRRDKVSDEFKASKTPRGMLLYNNWLGVLARDTTGTGDLRRRAECLRNWGDRSRSEAKVIVAGWAMDKAKAADLTFSREPLIILDEESENALNDLILAAKEFASALRRELAKVIPERKPGKGEALNAAREVFFLHTQAPFEQRAAQLTSVNFSVVARAWLADMRAAALAIFDAHALPGLSERDVAKQAMLIRAQRNLSAAFAGYGKSGQAAFMALGLEVPEPRKGRAA